MKTIDGLDGNGLLKAHAFLMEDKMAAGAFGALGTMGETAPLIRGIGFGS